MTDGVLLGLAAALCWGLTDLIAAVAGRRVGTLRAAALSLTASLVVLAALVPVTGATFRTEPADLVRIGSVGALAAISTLALWTGLRHGPLTVVSPIAAGVGAVTVILAWAVLGEQPRAMQWLAVPVAVVGGVLASTVAGAGRRPRLVGRGPLFALVAVLGFSLVAIALREPVREFGWLQTIVVARAANTGVVWLVLAGSLGRPNGAGRASGPANRPAAPSIVVPESPGPIGWAGWRLPALVVTSGALDAAGFSAFAIGFEVAPVWLIGLLSSFAPAVGVIGGVWLFAERPHRRQWLGAGAMAIAVVLVALG